ncbi:MAG: ABC transporter ATP-binding protein, partial [Filifactoraceae bacterium]
MSLLEINNISKRYKESFVIKDVSLKVEEGEVVSILGPSGVGKTTLFNIISAIEDTESGSVYFKGEDVTGEKGHYSYMQQKDLLLEHKTVLDNVALPMILKGENKEKARVKALNYFKKFNLLGSENKYPKELSGGMKQRASFLRAFLYSSEMMLLDEPFSALDTITKGELHTWYLDIIKKYNIT